MTWYRPFEPLLPVSAVIHGPALVVAPHPDDELLGCGGLILGHREAGQPVDVAILTDGGLGNPTGEGGPGYTALRKEETRRALDRVGGATVHFLDHPDGRLRDAHGAVDDLIRVLQRVRPAAVFFPSPYEVHPDHRAACLHVFRAVRALDPPPALYLYEVGAMMPANCLVDITPHMLRKEEAIALYHSQILHQDLIGKVRAVNRARTVNVDDPDIRYAEALIRVDPARADMFLHQVEDLLKTTDSMRPA